MKTHWNTSEEQIVTIKKRMSSWGLNILQALICPLVDIKWVVGSIPARCFWRWSAAPPPSVWSAPARRSPSSLESPNLWWWFLLQSRNRWSITFHRFHSVHSENRSYFMCTCIFQVNVGGHDVIFLLFAVRLIARRAGWHSGRSERSSAICLSKLLFINFPHRCTQSFRVNI